MEAQTARKRLKFDSFRAHHLSLVQLNRNGIAVGVLRLRSGFRLAAQTPRKRLKFDSFRAHHFFSVIYLRRSPHRSTFATAPPRAPRPPTPPLPLHPPR